MTVSELTKWDNFYVIVGSAAGALIGLQFVVITLIAEKPPVGVADAAAAFGSPTIVHFSVVLFLAALLHAPWESITIAAALWGCLGIGGLIYTVIVARRMRKQIAYTPQFEDWLFHCLLPCAAYATLALSSFETLSHMHEALFGVGGAALLLLLSGIHNAWDNVSYHVLFHRASTEPRRDGTEASDNAKN
ncbi:MAG TPA: hypothetical protein VMG31_13695 [Verrucomicrobiae bacterium]|nr:hypothetical protein [Verrucomicrobiae bacterium]